MAALQCLPQGLASSSGPRGAALTLRPQPGPQEERGPCFMEPCQSPSSPPSEHSKTGGRVAQGLSGDGGGTLEGTR